MKKQKVRKYKGKEIFTGHFVSVGISLLISNLLAFKDSNSLESKQANFIFLVVPTFLIHILYLILGSSSYFLLRKKIANEKYKRRMIFFLPLYLPIFCFIAFFIFESTIDFDMIFLNMNVTMCILWALNYYFLNKDK